MPERELKVLEELAGEVPENGLIVELGSFVGRSSWCLAKSAHPSVRLECIDIWLDYTLSTDRIRLDSLEGSTKIKDIMPIYPRFLKYTKDCPNLYHQRLFMPDDLDVLKLNKKIDLLFIDAFDHDFENFYTIINDFEPHINPNTVICGHDYYESNLNKTRAIRLYAKKKKKTVRVFEDTTIWVLN